MKLGFFIIMALSACSVDSPAPKASVQLKVSAYRSTIAVRTPDLGQNEKIEAWVNGEPIRTDVVDRKLERINAFRRQQNRPISMEEITMRRRHIVDTLIDDALIRQHAEKNRILISERRVLDKLARVKKEEFGGDHHFNNHLNFRGLTPAEYKQEMRRTMVVDAMIKAPKITDEERSVAFQKMFDQRAVTQGARLSLVKLSGASTPIRTPKSYTELKRLKADRMSRHELGWVSPDDVPHAPIDLFQPGGPTSKTITTHNETSVFWVHQRRPIMNALFIAQRPQIDRALEREKREEAFRRLVIKLRHGAVIQRTKSD